MFSRSDFAIFANNPELVYLDGASTTPKPSYVIDKVDYFLTHEYANIHRGQYSLALASERLYRMCKEKIATRINADVQEIIFTQNSTSSSNMIVDMLRKNKYIQSDDVIILSIAEHHANVVPRQMLCNEVGCRIEWIGLDKNFDLDIEDFLQKYSNHVKVVALSYVSNVTGTIHTLHHIKQHLRDDTIFIVDASQSLPHIPLDVKVLGCHACYFTGHKLYAYTGIGVLYLRKSFAKTLQPSVGGGGMIDTVDFQGFRLQGLPDRFEAGTPNLVGIASFLAALEYIEQHGRYLSIHVIEQPLVEAWCQYFSTNTGLFDLLGTLDPNRRVGVFSFTTKFGNTLALSQHLANHHICVRAGAQCAHPLHLYYHISGGTCRISLGVWNTEQDILKFQDCISVYLSKFESL